MIEPIYLKRLESAKKRLEEAIKGNNRVSILASIFDVEQYTSEIGGFCIEDVEADLLCKQGRDKAKTLARLEP